MNIRRLTLMKGTLFSMLAVVSLAMAAPAQSAAQKQGHNRAAVAEKMSKRVTQAQRNAAVARVKAAREAILSSQQAGGISSLFAPPPEPQIGQGDVPDYFSPTVPNWAYSPPLRKFVDTLSKLGPTGANNLGQYIPVAVADTLAYPGSDYYELELRQYTEKMHSDLPSTTLRGYVQVKNGVDVAPIHYLGPLIIAQKDRPVRIKFTNMLPIGSDGNLFIPVDTTVMGSGMGPKGMVAAQSGHVVSGSTVLITTKTPHGFMAGDMVHLDTFIPPTYNGMYMIKAAGLTATTFQVTLATDPGGPADPALNRLTKAGIVGLHMDMEGYTQNRGTLHLHGGLTPWISDGTPHQWVTPAGETTSYPAGASTYNVPDMPDPGPGGMTFYWTNQQSSRLMFFHDHVYGITRLNVYVGEAAGYVIQDPVEDTLVAGNYIPAEQIPLIIQDKTFVDAATIGDTDPTWRWGTGADGDGNGYPDFKTGDLWVPHVYMPAQNPADLSGMAPMGRWHYGPWFWPPVTDIQHGPVPNPYYDSWFAGDIDPNGVPYLSDGPATRPWEPKYMPGVPDPSVGMEHYNDTPLVNGTAYPTLTVDPKAYRFRILNAANDRFFNLQFYVADPAVSVPDPQRSSPLTEVKMVPACNDGSLPDDWPMDGREGGVPDPALKGPDWIQIGTEGGFLPAPAVIPARPITWNWDQTTFNMGNVIDHSLLLGCAERADVIVDFSGYAGKTLILYNDAPVAFPALDPRQDYYTGMPDMRDTGSHWPTLPGFGPNVRTVMQIIVRADAVVDPWLGQTALETEWASATGHPGVFERAQDPILVGQSAYDSAYTRPIGTNPDKLFPAASPWWGYSGISTTSLPFETLDGTRLSIPMARKALHDEMGGVYDQWGRMSGKLGTEVPGTNALTQAFSPLAYMDPSTEILVNNTTATLLTPVLGDGTQIWKFTHNGVDTHPIHFHLFNVQLVNRVGWDGAIRLPDANELGWKETIRVSPLEDTIVAMRPYAPDIPFKIPDSVRLLDPTMPVGATWQSWDPVTGNGPVIISNAPYNYGWEYMLHCHVLSHEEMEMMRPIDFLVSPAVPSSLTAVWGGSVDLAWTNNSTVPAATNLLIQRATDADFTLGVAEFSVADPAATAFVDTTVELGITYYYRLRAENTISYSAWSNTSSILTPVPTPPAAPTNLAAVLQAGPQIQLTWMDNATNETGFVIERSVNGGAFAQLAAPGPLTGTGNVTYLDTTVVASNSYAYRVYAKNGTLSSAYSNTVTVVLRLPVAPSNLVATLNAGSQVSLTFRDNSNIETVFIMERSVNGGAFVQLVALAANAGTGNVTYLDTTVAVGNTYAYRVKAVAGALSSAYSNTASVSVILLAPTNLVATLNAVTQVSLTFRDNSTIETGFIMERSVNGGAFSQIAARGPRNGTGGVTYVDTTVAAGNTYAYRVMAVAGAISSAYTNTATVVVPSLPAAPTNVTVTAAIRNNTNARITLNWTDVATNNTGYTVQYSLDPNFVPIGGTATLGANAITYRTGNVARGTTFYLRVRAFNLGGTSAWVTISITTP